MNIEELTALIKSLNEVKESLMTIAAKCDTAQSYLEVPSRKLIDFYTINDDAIDHNDIKNVKEELIAKRDRIKNIIIPEIESKVSIANQDIARIEEEERRRAEQARIEEENRQRAAAELAAASQGSTGTAPVSTTAAPVQSAPIPAPKPTQQQSSAGSQQSAQSTPKPKPRPVNGATTAV